MDTQQFQDLLQELEAQTVFLSDIQPILEKLQSLLEMQRNLYAVLAVMAGVMAAGFMLTILFVVLSR